MKYHKHSAVNSRKIAIENRILILCLIKKYNIKAAAMPIGRCRVSVSELKKINSGNDVSGCTKIELPIPVIIIPAMQIIASAKVFRVFVIL